MSGSFTGWNAAKTSAERRFSVKVDAGLPEGSSQDVQNNALEAASQLTSLPWELLHNGSDYLSGGAHPVRVRRRLPNYTNQPPMLTQLPIRILLLSPRPEDEHADYIDHRASAGPLVEAVEGLGDLVELTVLTPPTYGALQNELQRAKAANKPYHVLHFDGHGVYDARHGLGALCFEDPKESNKLEQRAMQLVYAKYDKDTPGSDKNIASLLHEYRIPLVFLEACQTAQAEVNPNDSVAASLLEEGVASVIAMSHSVLVKTATIFVTAFYQSLAQGQRVGQAMQDGQKALKQDSYRFPILGAGELHMQDWFVPILYQEKHDPHLFDRIPGDKADKMSQQQQKARLGKLPDTPTHTFIGRSRELLKLERMLVPFDSAQGTGFGSAEGKPCYAVIKGQGGIGKTTLAVELSRWLVRSARFDRCAFVSLEAYSHDRAVLDELGRQLVGSSYSVAEYGDLTGDNLKKAMQPIQRVLENESCLLLLDNMESLLANNDNIQPVLQLAHALLASDSKTTVLFTTRENLPAPFDHNARQVSLGELSGDDARALIMKVMAEQGLELKHDDQGRTPEEVNALVNAVNGHARALVLLARELSIQGVTATTQNLQHIMQKLEQDHPGDRENSLFASVELSLQRLLADSRELLKGLAVFHDGGDLTAIAYILDIEPEAATQLGAELIQVGLAEEKAYGYLRLDPALPNYLSLQLQGEQKQQFYLQKKQRWFEVMSLLVDFLYQQRSKDAKLSSKLTQLELPNLMAFVRGLNDQLKAEQAEAEIVTGRAGKIEQLLEFLNYPQALAEVVSIRQQATGRLGEWSGACFNTELLTIERHLTQGELQQAYEKAQKLLQQSEQANSGADGEVAYSGADYNLAVANYLLGQVLNTGSAAAEALPYLQQAQQRFEALGEQGARMASVALAEQGDCLLDLGQLDQAAAVYEESIKRAEKLDDTRQVAAVKIQLATVRMEQKDYSAALQGYHEAMELFQQMNEPSAVAGSWHQIGMVYREQNQFDQAESAYRQSLSIRVTNKLRADEAASLGELANLYSAWDRPEQAVDYYRQAVDIYTQLGDRRYLGVTYTNIANTLIKLKHLDLARPELLRAIKCNASFGHAAQPWVTWDILHNLEQADGNPQAAQQARQKAIQAYLDYRRDGGEAHSGAGRLALAVLQAIQQQQTTQIEQVIEQYLEQDNMQEHKTFLHHLQSILAGDRNPALAEDDKMYYQQVVELKLLLESLD